MEIIENIIDLLKKRGQTISTMESCTGGAISNAITNISGSSEVFSMGFITYSNNAKTQIGVDKKIIDQYTVYSPETAIEMAKTAMIKANSNYGIGVTGQLGRYDPNNNNVSKLNTIWFAISTKNFVKVYELQVKKSSRTEQKQEIVIKIFKELYMLLEKGD